jgi:hypothetical protein
VPVVEAVDLFAGIDILSAKRFGIVIAEPMREFSDFVGVSRKG